MSNDCTRKLVVRWAFLAFAIGQAVVLVLWATKGELPWAQEIRITPHSSAHLPLALPRFIDPFVMMIPAALLAWACLDLDRIANRWTKGRKPAEAPEDSLIVGMVMGVVGGSIVADTGMGGVLVGSLLAGLVILIGGLMIDQKPRDSSAVAVAGAITMWLVNTLTSGSLAGIIYAASAFAIAAGVIFGLYYLVVALGRFLRGPFYRTFVSCEVAQE